MIATTYSLEQSLFCYNGEAIEAVTVKGAIVAPETEDYWVLAQDSTELVRVNVSQLYSSIDKLADQIVQIERSNFESRVTAIKAVVEQALDSYNEKKEARKEAKERAKAKAEAESKEV